MAKTIVTHDGKFHADEVFAVAALLILETDAKVIRTRDAEVIRKADIVLDVGGVYDDKTNRFDHHQIKGAGKRPAETANGGECLSYAAFGLVWKKFGEKLCGSLDVALRVEEVLVAPIDANDNGINLSTPLSFKSSPYDIADAIRSFTPTWLEKDASIDERFMEATLFARRIIEREVKRAEAVAVGMKKVKEAYTVSADKRLIILDQDYSWKDTLAQFSEPLYVVHPQNGSWRLYCVRDNSHFFVNRKDLPKSWAGLRDSELAKLTGVLDAVFVHRNRFMAVAKTKEGAITLAKLALQA